MTELFPTYVRNILYVTDYRAISAYPHFVQVNQLTHICDDLSEILIVWQVFEFQVYQAGFRQT